MQVGDLVRYKHNKNRMGLVIDGSQSRTPAPARKGRHATVLILWLHSSGDKRKWRVELQHIEVKGEGRYGWRDAA